MGFLNSADTGVEINQKEYYRLIQETTKAELIQNGLKCEIPPEYIKAMLTGKMLESEPEKEEAESNLAEWKGAVTTLQQCRKTELRSCGVWGELVILVEAILSGWEKEDQIQALSENIRILTEETVKARLKEVRMRNYERWARENEEPVQAEKELEKIRILGETDRKEDRK